MLTIISNDPNQGNIDVNLSGSGFLIKNADLAITKSDSADPVTVGDDFIYQITVTNIGPDDATGVIAVDNLPPEVTFKSAFGCTETGGQVTCNLPNLPLNAETILDIAVTANTAGSITNQATVFANENDPNPGNNTAFHDTVINESPGN